MNRVVLPLLALAVAAALILAGCSQAAPAPTAVPAAPTKAPAAAAEPTKAAVAPAAPTQAPAAKKVEWPEKGKSITVIVPWAAGGANDLGARALSTLLEKELGVPVNVVNKPGANGQVGITEVALAKPDGYTLGIAALPSTNTLYLDPDKKAAFNRKSLIGIALHTQDPVGLAVKADSPFKTAKDLVEAAKAKPDTVKVGAGGILNVAHIPLLQLQNMTGAKFSLVQFDGGTTGTSALLGGHVDAHGDTSGTLIPHVKSGTMRVVGVFDEKEYKYLPGVPTMESQGYKLSMSTARTWAAPAGTPQEVIDILATALKKTIESDEHQKKLAEMSLSSRFMGPAELGAFWDKLDADIAPLVELAKTK